MNGNPSGRRAKLIADIRNAIYQRGYTPASFEDGMVRVGAEEIPLDDFEADFAEALATLLDRLRPQGRSFTRTEPHLYFGPSLPQRPNRVRYGKDVGEMSG